VESDSEEEEEDIRSVAGSDSNKDHTQELEKPPKKPQP